MADLLETARRYAAAGLSVIPVWADGSKAPKLTAWTRYGDAPPTEAELVEWFGRGAKGGIGIVGGPASGNLTVLDFETATVWDEWVSGLNTRQRAHADRCPLARTPRGGAHLYVRLPLPTRGLTLAEEPDGTDGHGRPRTRTLIETRAHGGQVLAPGCPPECHPLGRPYVWEREAWVAGGESHTVPLGTWVNWLERAESLSRVERPAAVRRPDNRDCRVVTSDDPGTDFNHRGTWDEAGLFAAGWEWVRDLGDDRGLVRRPGKGRGSSGTLGVVSSEANHWPLFHCFSSNAHPFEGGENYDRFGVFARLNHGGDFKAAARALRDLGYGQRNQGELAVEWAKPASPEGVGRGFKWSSELAAPEKADDWVWQGYLPRGGVALLSALWKIGKTTLLTHLLRASAAGGEFLGQPLKAGKVLYVSEEGERHWVRRRDALPLVDNVGFYLQPFATRPSADGWAAFVAQIKRDVEEFKFDLVVFDTLAKLWPVTEENDASSVDAALMPLWDVCKADAGVLLIHHLRKAGGHEYTGSRGSGALSAFPDILIEMVRFDAADARSRKRVLRAKGRYEETPDELVIELLNGEYVHVPGVTDDTSVVVEGNAVPAIVNPQPRSEEDRILFLLANGPTVGMTSGEVEKALRARGWGIRTEDVATHLASLYHRSQVTFSGKLRNPTNPRRWKLATPPAPGSRGNESLEGVHETGIEEQQLEQFGTHSHGPFPRDPGAGGVSEEFDFGPELLLLIRDNGFLTADQLHRLTGRTFAGIVDRLHGYQARGVLVANGDTYSLARKEGQGHE